VDIQYRHFKEAFNKSLKNNLTEISFLAYIYFIPTSGALFVFMFFCFTYSIYDLYFGFFMLKY